MKQDFYKYNIEEKVDIFNKEVAGLRDWYDPCEYKINGKWYISGLYYIDEISEEDLQDDENDIIVKGYVKMIEKETDERIIVKAKFRFVWKKDYWDLEEWYEDDKDYVIEDFSF